MVWQDIVITIVTILISYALVPQVYKGFKNKKDYVTFQTSLITFIAISALAFSYLTLELYLSSIIALINTILWLILFIQSIIYKK